MGAAGAALATILSQGLSCVFVIRFLLGNKTVLRLKKEYMRIQPQIVLPCVALGTATFIMQASESVISVCFNSSLLQYGGDMAVGAMTILTSVMGFAMMPLQGLGQGAQPISSYNYGAGNADRVRKAFYAQFITCIVYVGISWGIIMLAPGTAARIFTEEYALVEYTAWALRIYMAGIFAFGFQMSCQQAFMALGQAKVSLFLACLRKIILLIPLIFILPQLLSDKVLAVFLAEPVSDILAAVVTTTVFFKKFNKLLEK
jgi:Na+-driven multidrug efflux pump